jgi:hypothetical protein
MELGALNTMDDTVYRAIVMLIQGITLIIGLASLLFIGACLVSAASAFFQEMARPLRRRIKPGPEPDTQDIPAALARLDTATTA